MLIRILIFPSIVSVIARCFVVGPGSLVCGLLRIRLVVFLIFYVFLILGLFLLDVLLLVVYRSLSELLALGDRIGA